MDLLTDILRFVAIAQILLLLALFGRDKGKQRGAGHILFFGLCIVGYLLVDREQTQGHPAIFLPLLTLPFLAPAAFWLFSKSIFDDDYRWQPSLGWLLAGVVAVQYVGFFQTRQPFLPLPESIQLLLGWLLQLMSLAFILLGLLEAVRNREADLLLSRLQFRTGFIVTTAGLMLLTVLSEVSLRGASPPPVLDVAQKASIAGLAIFFSWRLLAFRPGFFPENAGIAKALEVIPEPDDVLLAQLSDLMDARKYWRTEGLTIRLLAEKMDVKEYRLRQAINRHLGYRNFNDYLNGYRVREACLVLSDPEKRALTVLELAYDLGYVSLAPFNKAFKDTTGMTPTEWRRAKTG
jgi:AraC-like DNA-binding protein